MPIWLKVAAGSALGLSLIGFAGLQSFSEKTGPLVQEHGTTYYNGEGPAPAPAICTPSSITSLVKTSSPLRSARAI
jgi:hypothetical protein